MAYIKIVFSYIWILKNTMVLDLIHLLLIYNLFVVGVSEPYHCHFYMWIYLFGLILSFYM